MLFIGIHILFFFFFFSFWQALAFLAHPVESSEGYRHLVTLSPQPLQTSDLGGLMIRLSGPRRMILGRDCVFIRQLTATGSPELHLQVSSSRGEGMEGSRGEGMEGWTDMLMDIAGDGLPEWTPSPPG